MKKYKAAMIKGICSGALCSLFINIWVIISFQWCGLLLNGIAVRYLGIFTYEANKDQKFFYKLAF